MSSQCQYNILAVLYPLSGEYATASAWRTRGDQELVILMLGAVKQTRVKPDALSFIGGDVAQSRLDARGGSADWE